jgi:hypothetical protein
LSQEIFNHYKRLYFQSENFTTLDEDVQEAIRNGDYGDHSDNPEKNEFYDVFITGFNEWLIEQLNDLEKRIRL